MTNETKSSITTGRIFYNRCFYHFYLLCIDLINFNLCISLSMTIFLMVTSFSLILINNNLFSLAITHNGRSEEHTSELQSRFDLVCRLLLEKKNYKESR